jgi:hypothetical protein
MYKITQEDYDVIVFLTKLVYLDLKFPEPFERKERIEKITGLRIDIFDMGDYELFIMCGTNGLNDWVANLKVGLGFIPRQYEQAYFNVKNRMPNSSKPVIIAGHSLGGGLAEYVASNLYYHQQVICLTFNGCGVSHLIHPILRKTDDMFNIITDDDILNSITKPLCIFGSYMQHTGKVIMVKDKHFFLSVKSHCNFAAFNKVTVEELYSEVIN